MTWKSPTGLRLRVPHAAVSSRCWAGEDDFGVDVEIVIRKHHLPHVFPPNVLDEARAAAHLDSGRSRPPPRFSRACPSSPSTARPPRISTTPSSSAGTVLPGSCRSTSPMSPQYVTAWLGARSRSAPARHLCLFSRSRRSHAPAGAFQRHLQPAAGGRSPGSLLHHDDRSQKARSSATRSLQVSSARSAA